MNLDPLQELYAHLEHCQNGDRYMAWYGQARAKGLDHTAAIKDTLDHYRIRTQEWYKVRKLPSTL